MKIINLLSIFFILHVHNTNSYYTLTDKDVCTEIKTRYEILANDDSYQNERAFLNSFPNNFPSFMNIFGYKGRSTSTSRIVLGCLYENSSVYIEKLFSLKYIPIELLYSKILLIAKEAQWQSDGMTFFQEKCINLLNSKLFLEFLNSRNIVEIKQFNRFIFLNPVKDTVLKQRIRIIYSKYNNLSKSI